MCLYICICIPTYEHIHIYIYIYICVCVCVYVNKGAPTSASVHTPVRVKMCPRRQGHVDI